MAHRTQLFQQVNGAYDPPNLSHDEFDKERDFVRYILVFFGFVFALIFAEVLRTFLTKSALGIWTLSICWAGASLALVVQAYTISRMALIYTRKELLTAIAWRSYLSNTWRSLLGLLAAHTYLVFIPCLYLKSLTGSAKIWESSTCISMMLLDVFLLVSLCGLAVFAKLDGHETDLY